MTSTPLHTVASPNRAIMMGRLTLAMALTAAILVVQVAGGLAANSLALLSDSGHVFTDLLALALAWYGLKQAERSANLHMTYGYHRVGIFAAFLNAATLIGVVLLVLVEAYRRLNEPHPVAGELVSGVALLGLAGNFAVMLLLRAPTHNLTMRSAFLHVLGDLLGSVAVVASGIAIALTGAFWVDPVISIGISGIIILGSLRILRESTGVLLERVPRGLDMSEVVWAISSIPGVKNVHHLHVWSITPEYRALSAHLSVDDTTISEASQVLAKVNEMLERRFAIAHSTIQLETPGCDPNELYCSLGPEGEPQPVAQLHHSH